MAEQKEQVLPKEPPILARIAAVRQKLAGTDRDDHLAVIDDWERKAKKALIFLNLRGHEGIEMVISKAKKEVSDINAALLQDKAFDAKTDHATLIADTLHRQNLLNQRALWGWFLGLFNEADFDLKTVSADLDVQEAPEQPEDQP